MTLAAACLNGNNNNSGCTWRTYCMFYNVKQPNNCGGRPRLSYYNFMLYLYQLGNSRSLELKYSVDLNECPKLSKLLSVLSLSPQVYHLLKTHPNYHHRSMVRLYCLMIFINSITHRDNPFTDRKANLTSSILYSSYMTWDTSTLSFATNFAIFVWLDILMFFKGMGGICITILASLDLLEHCLYLYMLH